MLRRLRIAVSVFFVVLTVLLSVLWVRSYWRHDILEKVTPTRIVQLHSARGRLSVWQNAPRLKRQSDLPLLLDELSIGRTFMSNPVAARTYPADAKTFLGFGWYRRGSTTIVYVPWAFLVLISITLVVASRHRDLTRFSLRTMLIAITLVAVMMGLIAWQAS